MTLEQARLELAAIIGKAKLLRKLIRKLEAAEALTKEIQ